MSPLLPFPPDSELPPERYLAELVGFHWKLAMKADLPVGVHAAAIGRFSPSETFRLLAVEAEKGGVEFLRQFELAAYGRESVDWESVRRRISDREESERKVAGSLGSRLFRAFACLIGIVTFPFRTA